MNQNGRHPRVIALLTVLLLRPLRASRPMTTVSVVRPFPMLISATTMPQVPIALLLMMMLLPMLLLPMPLMLMMLL